MAIYDDIAMARSQKNLEIAKALKIWHKSCANRIDSWPSLNFLICKINYKLNTNWKFVTEWSFQLYTTIWFEPSGKRVHTINKYL